jgi:hypothetical protein
MEIAFTAGDEVRAAIARIGRTEDLHFSPGGDRLALVGMIENRILLLDVEADFGAEAPRIRIAGCLEIDSDALRLPHGLGWLDERTVAVANRAGEVAIFALPDARPGSGRVTLRPERSFGATLADLARTPGSVAVAPAGLGLFELLVCNNYVHHVTRHLIDGRGGYALLASEILVKEGLEVPDGVAQSPSGRWIAVSNHNRGCVFVFRNDDGLDHGAGPDGVLRGVRHPHGLTFSADERALLVADAEAPFVHLFRSDDCDWSGERAPSESIRVFGDETFARGNLHPGEGGPKGIGLAESGALMAISCEERPLAFFDVRGLGLAAAPTAGARRRRSEAERARATLLRYLAARPSSIPAAAEAIVRQSEREVQQLLASRSWRLTALLRWLATLLRGGVRRPPRSRPRLSRARR